MNIKELYQVERISDQVVIIFCTTYTNPISYLPSIEEDLGKMNFSGKVIFDLLLSNGYSPNRFIEADINKSKINRRSMRVIESSNLDKLIISKALEFYRSHSQLVERNNILLEEEKYHLMHS